MTARAAYGFTPEGFADALQKFGKDVRPAIAASLKASATTVKDTYVALALNHGVIRTIFGKNARGLFGLVRTRVTDTGSSFRLSLELHGLAGLQEAGGHTRPPRKGGIFPHAGTKALAMKIGGGIVFAASAKHRGAQIAKFPVGERAMFQVAPYIASGIDKAIARTFVQHGIEAA